MIATEITLRPIMSHMTQPAPKPTMICWSQTMRFIRFLAFRLLTPRLHSLRREVILVTRGGVGLTAGGVLQNAHGG